MGESFAPICACGPNAAIIHYEQNENLHSDANKDLIPILISEQNFILIELLFSELNE